MANGRDDEGGWLPAEEDRRYCLEDEGGSQTGRWRGVKRRGCGGGCGKIPGRREEGGVEDLASEPDRAGMYRWRTDALN